MDSLREELASELQGDETEKSEGLRAFEAYVEEEGRQDDFDRLQELTREALRGRRGQSPLRDAEHTWLDDLRKMIGQHRNPAMTPVEGFDELWPLWTQLVDDFDSWLDGGVSDLDWSVGESGVVAYFRQQEEAGEVEPGTADRIEERLARSVPEVIERALENREPKDPRS